MTRAWGKFQPVMSSMTWIRMDTIIRIEHIGHAVKLHLSDGATIDVRSNISSPDLAGSAAALMGQLIRDLSSITQRTRALTDYTGAVK